MLLLIIPNVIAIEDYSEYSALQMRINISSGFDIVYGSNHDFRYMEVNISMFPLSTYGQNVIDLNSFSEPEAQVSKTDNSLVYKWERLKVDEVNYGLSYQVLVEDQLRQIDKGITFPVLNLDESYDVYLEPTEMIDLNDDIINKANDIVSGETDLYVAVFKVAEWVRTNVNYDLSSVTADAVQKSSWVYENKRGVCDELTSLFISMLRSVGVPARFVSGVVYTNSIDNWGNHGWAEVYFPGYGWIPFDVTYGQYGWVDPSHVKLQESLDSSVSSVRYSWKGRNVEISSKGVNIDTELIGNGVKNEQLVDLKVNLLDNEVGGGSYVPVEVLVENKKPYYISTGVQVVKAPELKEDNLQVVLLKPYEKKKVYWTVILPKDLEFEYIYSTVFAVKDYFGSSASTNLNYNLGGDVATSLEAEDKVNKLREEENKKYSSNVDLRCGSIKENYYTYEGLDVNCSVENTGNVYLKDLKICFLDYCNDVDLGIAEKKNFNYIFNLSEYGRRYFFVSVKNEYVSKTNYLDTKIFDIPKLKIENLTYPEEVNYKDVSSVNFVLDSSGSYCKNVIINMGDYKITIYDLKGGQDILLPFFGGDYLGRSIKVKCEDANGREFYANKELKVSVMNAPFFVKLKLLILGLFF